MRALLVTLTALLLVAAPAAADPPRLGIGDQKPSMFADLRYQELELDMSRLVVPWDALRVRWQREEIDAWLDAAREAGVEPLVIFNRSRRPSRAHFLPTRKQYVREFRRFRARYPWVKEFATWNEANLCGQPTCRKPAVVARYWKALERNCRSCTILASSVLDMPNLLDWVQRFQKAAGTRPRHWGLNNYRDVNYRWTKNTRGLLKITRGELWLTETAGIVKRRNISRIKFVESADRAAGGLRWLFRRIVPLSSRISRVYLYHWSSSTRRDTWDSAMVDWRGRERPALEVLRRQLAAWR